MNIAQRVGAVSERVVTRTGALLHEGARAIWRLIGSRQVFNGLLATTLLVLVYLAQQAFHMQRYLGAIAEAQQISGYATMRQMQAMGWAPDGKGAPVPGAAPAPQGAPAAPQTIDPSLLEPRSAASSAPAASAAATAQHTSPTNGPTTAK